MISEEMIALRQAQHRRKRLLIRIGIFLLVLILIPIVYLTYHVVRFYPKIKSGELTSYNQVRISRALTTAQSASSTISPEDLALLVPTSTYPEFGAKDGVLTLVEFVDYQCPYSKEMLLPISASSSVMGKYTDRIHFIVRDFPVTEIHPDARNAAHAANCVLEQGQAAYWRYQTLLFGDQSHLSLEGLRAKANLAKINAARFDECMTDRRYDLKIDQEIEYAKRIGVEGTPTFFLNGIKVEGSMEGEDFDQLLKSALSQLVQ